VPQNLQAARQSLGEFVATFRKNLPPKPIDHRNHAQWLYHKRHFRSRIENRLRHELTRRRKGEPPVTQDSVEQRPPSTKSDAAGVIGRLTGSVVDRVRTIGHPYKNSRSALQKLIHKLAGRNPSVLVVCERNSYLLSALDHLLGVQTHLTADVVVDEMNCWDKTATPFDVCLLEAAGGLHAPISSMPSTEAAARRQQNPAALA
jgi:hypothetical protein